MKTDIVNEAVSQIEKVKHHYGAVTALVADCSVRLSVMLATDRIGLEVWSAEHRRLMAAAGW